MGLLLVGIGKVGKLRDICKLGMLYMDSSWNWGSVVDFCNDGFYIEDVDLEVVDIEQMDKVVFGFLGLIDG